MRRAALLWLGLAAIVVAGSVTASGADFAASSASPGNAFVAAADFNTVAVAFDDPGAGPLHGTVALAATASSERGIDVVRFESSPAGAGAWTEACEDDAAPYACDWDTAGEADGSRDIRAVAVDLAGYSRATEMVTRLVDNGAPSVSLADPGPWLEGTAVLTTTGADPHSGLTTLAIDYRPAGVGAWTELCSGPISPRVCPLQTTTLADGPYELRARAADAAGNSKATTPLTRTVDNNAPTVAMTDPGAMKGTVTLGATAGDGNGTGVASVRYEHRQGAGSWIEACTGSPGCSWNTATMPDGLYDLRAVATDGTGRSTISVVLSGRAIDNSPPAVPTLVDPGTSLRGAVAVSGTASDSSGAVTWIAQYRTAGGGTWTDACSDTSSPFGCTWATTAVADGLYDLRAVARDAAGNERASAVLSNRRVDNTAPALTFADPGALILGVKTLTATATDVSGVTAVVFERRPSAGGAWTTICTDNAAAYTCAFDTTIIADGDYELRARAADPLGNEATITRTTRVDNTPPNPVDVQAGNGGGVAGRPDTGDWIRLTSSEPLAPATVLAGWDGSPVAVRALFENRNGGKDELDFYDSTATTRLNLVATNSDLKLNADVVANTVDFDATMTRSGSSITITLGARRSGTVTTGAAAIMQWRASTLATDLAGNACLQGQVTESGGSDVDF